MHVAVRTDAGHLRGLLRFPGFRVGDVALFALFMLFALIRGNGALEAGQGGDLLAASHMAIVGLALFVNGTLFLLRGPAIARGAGLAPKLTALVGSWSIVPLAMLPLTWRPDWLLAATTVGLVAVYLVVLWALVTLRRSFSVFPEARALIRRGPYALVRHPLYAAYISAYVVIALPRLGLPALIVAGVGIGGEMLRARHEERVLGQAFADYDGYARVTPRFVPRLGRRR